MASEVKVPVLGESITEATIGEWLKKPGEAVESDEPIASLETDKVTIEVPAPSAGVMGDYISQLGDTVEVGAIIAMIEDGQAATAPVEKQETVDTPAAPASTTAVTSGEMPTMSPSVRRLVLEHGIDPTKVNGTGKDGRLTKEDILAAVETQGSSAAASSASSAPIVSTPAPAIADAPMVDAPLVNAPLVNAPMVGQRIEERQRMTRLRQTIAKRLKSAQEEAALLTTFNDVDMSAVMETRAKYKELFEKKHGVKLGFMGFFAKAAALAAKSVPSVNAQIDGDEIVYYHYMDISVAVSAPNGLVVPVVRNADSMSFAQIESTIGDFGKRAKRGELTMDEMKGGTFTISNGGVFGSLMSTPIINPPQSAVLGLHRIEQRPVVLADGSIAARPMMYIALSYDHRLIDGREAVTFLKIVKEAIEDPTRLLIDL